MGCANTGTLTVEVDVEPCQIALYSITLTRDNTQKEVPVLCGVTDSGRPLSEDKCKVLPVKDSTEDVPAPLTD